MSGVNMDSFYRKITYQQLTPEGLASLAPSITAMARAERLDAHALAVEIRTHKQLLYGHENEAYNSMKNVCLCKPLIIQ